MVVKTNRADLDAVVFAMRERGGFRTSTDVSVGLRGTDYIYVYGTRKS